MNKSSNLVQAESAWHGRITELQTLISELEAEVVEAEVVLAEEITAVNGFEFKLRAGVRHLVNRLEELGDQIADLRKQLRRQDDYLAGDPGEWAFQDVGPAFHEPGLDYNDYRYHSSMPQPPNGRMDEDRAAELKRLYRELARRFHPDMGAGKADRTYRTQLMMAINAAYGAGDLERLRQLAQEPDLIDPSAAAGDEEQMVKFLVRELARLQRRLTEIKAEMASLQDKQNYRLMKQAQRAENKGRDWLAEMRAQMQEEIAEKLVERDVLQQTLEFQEMMAAEMEEDADGDGLEGEDFAEAIWDISLDATFDDDPDLAAEHWVQQRRRDGYWEDDWDDDEEED